MQYVDDMGTFHVFTTDANGNVTLDNVPLGFDNSSVTYVVSAANAAGTGGAPNASVTIPDCGDTASASFAVHVPVRNFGEVDATVVDATTGLPIENATGSLVPSFQACFPQSVSGPTDVNGLASYLQVSTGLDDATSASCEMNMSAAGYYSLPLGFFVQVNAGQVTDVTISLQPMLTGTVMGTVTDAVTGQPIAGVDVHSTAGDITTDASRPLHVHVEPAPR